MAITDAINSILNPSSTADQIQRLLERQAANVGTGSNNPQQPLGIGILAPQYLSSITGNFGGTSQQATDPLSALQQQMFSQINSIPSYTTPLSVLQAQANSQAGAQYDPLIAALQSNIKTTTSKTKKNESQAKQMYNALGKDLASEIPGMNQQMQQAQSDASNRYNAAQQQMQQQYQNQSAQQQDVLKQLNLQAAQGQANQQQNADEQYFTNQSNLQKNADLDALKQQQQSANTYQQSASDNAKFAGVNAAQDLQSQLQDYLNQANGQLGTLQAQKSSTIASLLNQLEASDQKNAQTQHQQDLSNLMNLFNFQLNVQKEKDNQQNSSASGANNSIFQGTSGPQGASNYLSQALGPYQSTTASDILGMINDTMSDPNVIAGKHPEIDSSGKQMKDAMGNLLTIPNNDQYLEDLLRNKMENAGQYDTGNVNDAINALLAYLGKLR